MKTTTYNVTADVCQYTKYRARHIKKHGVVTITPCNASGEAEVIALFCGNVAIERSGANETSDLDAMVKEAAARAIQGWGGKFNHGWHVGKIEYREEIEGAGQYFTLELWAS